MEPGQTTLECGETPQRAGIESLVKKRNLRMLKDRRVSTTSNQGSDTHQKM